MGHIYTSSVNTDWSIAILENCMAITNITTNRLIITSLMCITLSHWHTTKHEKFLRKTLTDVTNPWWLSAWLCWGKGCRWTCRDRRSTLTRWAMTLSRLSIESSRHLPRQTLWVHPRSRTRAEASVLSCSHHSARNNNKIYNNIWSFQRIHLKYRSMLCEYKNIYTCTVYLRCIKKFALYKKIYSIYILSLIDKISYR